MISTCATGDHASWHVSLIVQYRSAAVAPRRPSAASLAQVGKEATREQLAAVRDHVLTWGQCRAVRPGWLQHCLASGALADDAEGGQWAIRASELAQMASSASAAAAPHHHQQQQRTSFLGGIASTTALDAAPAAASASEATDAAADAVDLDDRAAGDGGAALRGGYLLRGLWFTLVAVKGTDVEDAAAQIISTHGGMVFTELNRNKVRGTWLSRRLRQAREQLVVSAQKHPSPSGPVPEGGGT